MDQGAEADDCHFRLVDRPGTNGADGISNIEGKVGKDVVVQAPTGSGKTSRCHQLSIRRCARRNVSHTL
jgi:hypothetical protein